MAQRKTTLTVGEVYHICSKSIAGYIICNTENDYQRMFAIMKYYRKQEMFSFSRFMSLKDHGGYRVQYQPQKLVTVLAYCFMPTHIHLLLRQEVENGISLYMGRLLNSYSKYFNVRHKRKGPLWEGRFKDVEVKGDEQLLHLTRYIHLNPVTACIVKKPEQWDFSSYAEYVNSNEQLDPICRYREMTDIDPKTYSEFTLDQIAYQRELAKIKHLLLE